MEIRIGYFTKRYIKKTAHILEQIFLDILAIFNVFFKSCFFQNDLKKLKIEKFNELVVIGNGPSLRETLEKNIGFFNGKMTACVNEFAISEYFTVIKPDFYVFLDPAYWNKNASMRLRGLTDKDFKAFKENVTWPMTIIMPLCAKQWNWFMDLPKLNKNIKICHVNTTMVDCSKSLKNFLYSKNLAMPPAVNTLVGALFLAVNLGCKKIFLVGADHSWHENIFVGEDNVLYLKDEHFYFENNVSLDPLLLGPEETEKVKIHVLFKALSQAFEAYQEIAKYAEYVGAKIYNASKKTYIDAFERYKI